MVREGLFEKEAFEWVQRVSQVNGWGKILPRREVTFGTLEEERAVWLEHREGCEERKIQENNQIGGRGRYAVHSDLTQSLKLHNVPSDSLL